MKRSHQLQVVSCAGALIRNEDGRVFVQRRTTTRRVLPGVWDIVGGHLGDLVVKEVNNSGGYGMLIGPHATKAQISDFRERVAARPTNYIAQPVIQLSAHPTYTDHGFAPRRIDLRHRHAERGQL